MIKFCDEFGDLERKLKKLHNSMPNYHYYFPDHGIGHVKRILEIIKNKILPSLASIDLSSEEESILCAAVMLHDVGMANPRTNKNPNPGPPKSEADRRAIRDKHEELSCDFVKENYRELGIDDRHKADIVANLCYSHRQKRYIREVFKEEEVSLRLKTIRVHVLSAILKLADALDADYCRVSETARRFFQDLPEEDQWHWDACEWIRGLGFMEHSIRLEVVPPYEFKGDIEMGYKIVRRKACAIFSELFSVLPFLIPVGMPWVMIDLLIGGGQQSAPSQVNNPIWQDWWYTEIKAGGIHYTEIPDIAGQLKTLVRPLMNTGDVEFILKELKKRGYTVPPPAPEEVPGDTRLVRVFPKVSSDECKQSFLAALKGAQSSIELLSSDGLTFPKEVDDVLAEKLLEKPPIEITLFLLSGEVLFKIEGKNENLTLEVAKQKIAEARRKWKQWWHEKVKNRAGNRVNKIKKAFKIVFISSPELGHMNGSVLIDRKLIRINIHGLNASSSRGELLHCPEPTNLVPVIQHYVHDMRRFGTRWRPWEEEIGE